MVFSSVPFICFFLPATFLLYYLMPRRNMKNIILILVSIIFYSVGEPKYVFLMLASILVNYIAGIILGKTKKLKKIVLGIAITLDLSVLVLFKYAGLGFLLPVGISFYTFQAISYVIDVYRKPELSQSKILNVVLYISFFPQLIAGPIIKYHDIDEQIIDRKESFEKVYEGFKRFIYGLAKKALIANNMAIVVDKLFAEEFTNIGFASAWLAAICYMLQIYFDFSGYSDMAIGLGKIFGFEFKENFMYPYSAKGIKDFWRKWHISLSTWFKEYLYFPLGGNRKGKIRTYINKYIVFFLTGLWHGANFTFVLWGLWHGTFSVLEESKWFRKIFAETKVINRIYTWLVVMLGFVMFRADSIKQGFMMIGRMFIIKGMNIHQLGLFVSMLTPLFITAFIFAIILTFPVFIYGREKILKKANGQVVVDIVEIILTIVLLLLSMITLASGSYNPFIYFRF